MQRGGRVTLNAPHGGVRFSGGKPGCFTEIDNGEVGTVLDNARGVTVVFPTAQITVPEEWLSEEEEAA